MAHMPNFDQLLNETSLEMRSFLKPFLRRAFEAGVQAGEERYKERVANAFRDLGIQLPATHGEAVSATTAPPASTATSAPQEYGYIANQVRNALRAFANLPEGITPQEVTDYIHKWPSGLEITVAQVRTALKVMARPDVQEAIRVSRGRYIPGPKLLALATASAPEAATAAALFN